MIIRTQKVQIELRHSDIPLRAKLILKLLKSKVVEYYLILLFFYFF